MKKYLFALCLFLASCNHHMSDEDIIAMGKQQCAGMGFTPGTDTFSNCILQIRISQKNNEEQRQSNAIAGFYASQHTR